MSLVLYYWYCCYFFDEVWESKNRRVRRGKKSITIIDFGNLTNCYLHFAQSFSFTHRFPLYTFEKDEKNSFIDIDVKIISDSLDRYLSNEIDNMMCVCM